MEAKRKRKTTKTTKPKAKGRKKAKGKGLGKVSTAKRKAQPKKTAGKTRAAPNWFMPVNTPQKSSAEKIVLTTLTIGAAGVMGYLGLQLWKKHRQNKAANLDTEIDTITTAPIKEIKLPPIKPDVIYTPPKDTTHSTHSSSRNDDFPLKKGSKGDAVRQLQNALIGKYGTSILPKYGADGDFGSETQAALKKKGLPVMVTESVFNVITQGADSGGSSDTALAEQLHKAAETKNFSSAISLLKKISSKEHYQQVSNSFLPLRLRGVRQTLVNGMLTSFKDESQKSQIRMEFIRMGLQYRNNKFSLSGFDGKPLVTKVPATVWSSPSQSVQVPAMMVVGNEVTTRLDYTLFENNGKYYLIKTETVKYL
jgi:hypothetical protein